MARMRPTEAEIDAVISARLQEGDGECINWAGGFDATDKNGIGLPYAYCRGKKINVRRHINKTPLGMLARVTCGNPLCVNPAHIRAVKRSVILKGRKITLLHRFHAAESRRKGPHAKLDWDKAREIRRRLSSGDLNIHIAADYGVSVQLVTRVKQGKAWRETTPFSI